MTTPVHVHVLAAGQGRRLWPLTRDRPKSLIDLGRGTTLLGRQLDALLAHPSTSSVTVVTGHLDGQIDDFVGELADPRVRTRFNPFFATSGPVGSLWAVRDELEAEDFMVCNGDTLFGGPVVEALDRALTGGEGIALAVTRTPDAQADDVRVDLADSGVVRAVAKDLRGAAGRSAGVLLVRGTGPRRDAVRALDVLVRREESLRPDTPWHSWVDVLSRDLGRVRAALVAEDDWSEVDLHPELEQLRTALASKLP